LPGTTALKTRTGLSPVPPSAYRRKISFRSVSIVFLCLLFGSCPRGGLAQEEAFRSYYRGLAEEDGGPSFENALESSNSYIRLAAAEELILPLLRGGAAAEDFLERRHRAGETGPQTAAAEAASFPLRPLIAAALYGLGRWEEIPALYGPEQGKEAERGPLWESLDSWDRALLLMARLRITMGAAAGTGEQAADWAAGKSGRIGFFGEAPDLALKGGLGAAAGGPGKGRSPENLAAAETAAALAENLLAYFFEAPAGAAANWAAGESGRTGLFSEAQDSALEGRRAAARSSFRRGLALFGPALEKEPELFLRYPALLDDLGRSFQFGSSGTEGLELFLEWERQAPSPALAYRLLYFAGRIARARGLYGRGAEIFERALALAPDKIQEDACVWYILDAWLRDGESSGPELLELVKTWKPRWNDAPYFSDILDRIAQRLASSGQWELFPRFLIPLEQGGDPLSRAKYAYISGRALAAGLIPPENGTEKEDQIRRFFRAAYDMGTGALYYRAMSAFFLEEPVLPPEEDGPGERRVSHREELDFLRGFFEEGVGGAAERYVRALAGELNAEELRSLVESMEKAGAYPEQIRLISSLLVRGDYRFRQRDMELLSPRPFRELIETQAGKAALAPELLFGLIRTESAFQPEIISRAGAVGLTQLMPATAGDMADRIKRRGGPDYTENLDLEDPEINAAVGAYYLNHLRGLLDHPLLAILAYNGGPNRVRRWRQAQPALPGDLFLETVEYPETREYGRRVISAAVLYGCLYYGVNPPLFLADICK
jgi:soluble lytic murein transglycosylase